ncbi:MAG: hypothetical protein EBR82_13290 [Caulobacteraceae bacterium]|nr:hypothetical protein [Caulobacteraceae bacterium]
MEWAFRGIGVFYAVGGLFALWQLLSAWRIERALAFVAPSTLAERAADVMLALGSVLVLTSGLALMLLQPWAILAFLVCWGAQAGYLLWAQRWHRPRDPICARGRRQTLNAFAVYSLATLLVLSMPLAGLFH